MKRILFSIPMIALAIQVFGQFSVGIKSGADFQSVSTQGILEPAGAISQTLVAPLIGLFGEYQLTENIWVRTGMNFTQKGLVFSEDISFDLFNLPIHARAKARWETKYLDFPASIQYSVDRGAWSGYITGGAGVSKAISSKIDPRVSLLVDFNLPEINIPLSSFNNTQFYGLGGIGAAYKTPGGKIFAEVQYQHSFESLTPDFIVDLDARNKGFSVGIGYAVSF